MKKYLTIIPLLLSLILKAQESVEILDLKSKLDTASTLKSRTSLLGQLSQAYAGIQKFDSAIFYTDKMLAANDHIKDKDMLASINLLMSQHHLQQGKSDGVYPYLSKAEKLLEKSNDIAQMSLLNLLFGVYYFYKKEIKKGDEYFKRNINLYNDGKAVNKNLVMASYVNLFSTSFAQNNLKNTFEAVNKYYDFVKINFPDKLSDANFLLGNFYLKSRDFKKSILAFQKSLSFNKKENTLLDAQAKTFLAFAYIKSDKLDSAKYYIKGTKEYFEKSGDNFFLGETYSISAHILEKEKDFDKAEANILKAIELSPEEDVRKMKSYYQNQLYSIKLEKLFQDSLTLKTDPKKQYELKDWLAKFEKSSKDIEGSTGAQYGLYEKYEKLAKGYEYAENYDLALFYLKKAIQSKNVVFSQEKLREFSDFESEYQMKIEQNRIKLEEETKRLELEKQIELKALKFEFEKKQARAKTEEEKKRLVIEEELKMKLILVKYEEKQKEITLKFNQEKEIARISQEKKDALSMAEVENSKYQKNIWALGMVLSLTLLGFAGFSYYQKQKDNNQIAFEKQKSDDLLLNILPHEVAEELKLNGESSARHYDEVSVMFTDFVNFTQKSEQFGIQKILNELNECFTEFDAIMEKYGLEKIKTIGDAYLAVSGLPTSNINHAQNAVNAGLEILEYIDKKRSNDVNSFEIRIGIHSGPVIAGIVGVKKFAYDIWGDTVNTASRMEQKGEKGKLNVSGSTYDLIHEKYDCEHRGKIDTKGKGALDMYFVNKSI